MSEKETKIGELNIGTQSGLRKKTSEKLLEFEAQYAKKLSDYAGAEGLYFTIGKGWAIDLKKGKITADPEFFLDREYTQAESLWASMHEIEHFRRRMQDLETSDDIFKHIGGSKRKHTLYNAVEDILVNNTVVGRKPAYRETQKWLYKNKAFKEKKYTELPKHIQFVYTLLRESMLPQEQCEIDDTVREEVEKLRGGEIDIINLMNTPGRIDPKMWFKIMRDYLEPVYDNLFAEDLKQKKEQNQQKGEQGEPSEADFSDEYIDFAEKMPHPVDDDAMEDEVEKAFDKKQEEEKTPEEREKEAFERAHGVTKEAYENYQKNYVEKVKPYIERMREIFEKIISKREEVFLRLKRLAREGAMLHPGLATQAYIDKKTGVSDSMTELGYKKEVIDENKPNHLEISLVCDLSSSMTGEKLRQQQLATTLMIEALQDFEDMLKTEREEGKLELGLETEVRAFHNEDVEIKRISGDLSVKDSVNVVRKLGSTIGSTADEKSLAMIYKTLDEKKVEDISKGDLTKIAIVLSDGGSNEPSAVRNMLNKLREKGVVVVGVGMTSSATSILTNYAPDAEVCHDVSKLPEVMEKLLEKYLEQL